MLHREPVGASKRGRDRPREGSRKRGKGQAAVLPQGQGKAWQHTQARKSGRGGPARMEKRARQQGSLVTPTQALRPAPGIGKKLDGTKE